MTQFPLKGAPESACLPFTSTRPWASYTTSLGLGFLISKMGIIIIIHGTRRKQLLHLLTLRGDCDLCHHRKIPNRRAGRTRVRSIKKTLQSFINTPPGFCHIPLPTILNSITSALTSTGKPARPGLQDLEQLTLKLNSSEGGKTLGFKIESLLELTATCINISTYIISNRVESIFLHLL